MSVNTHNERAALISLALWRGRLLPRADGVLDVGDRVRLALLYPLASLVGGGWETFYGAQVNKTVGALISPE